MVKWWEPLTAAFRLLAECMLNSEIEPFPMASLCILHTSSNLQLGRVWYTLLRFRNMSSEDRKLFRPGQMRADLSGAIQAVVDERLENWDQYMTDNGKLRQGSCVFTCNDLNLLSSDEHMKYYHFAQLLQYLTSSHLNACDNSGLLRSLKTLQRDGFLGTGETPVPRYNQQCSKHKKEKTKKNADTIKRFIFQWVSNGRGWLSVVEDLPSPEDGAHTAMIIPAVLDCMESKLPILKQWGEWVLEKQRNPLWHPRAHLDGDLLQVFAALVASKFYVGDSQESDGSISRSSSSEQSDSNSRSRNDDSGDESSLKE
jgi:hypothetical protein